MTQRGRRKINRNPNRHVTPAAVEAFRNGDGVALAVALKLPPWYPSPMDTDDDKIPDHAVGTPYGNAWPEVRAIRLALEAAANEKN